MNERFRWSSILGPPIGFQPILVHITGSVTAALMLSQALYWSERTNDPDGWFYKSQQEWTEEICLSRREQEGARKCLQNTGFWHEKRAGNPARLFYRIDLVAFESTIDLYNQEWRKPPIKNGGNRHTPRARQILRTEITAESARACADAPPPATTQSPPEETFSSFGDVAPSQPSNLGRPPLGEPFPLADCSESISDPFDHPAVKLYAEICEPQPGLSIHQATEIAETYDSLAASANGSGIKFHEMFGESLRRSRTNGYQTRRVGNLLDIARRDIARTLGHTRSGRASPSPEIPLVTASKLDEMLNRPSERRVPPRANGNTNSTA